MDRLARDSAASAPSMNAMSFTEAMERACARDHLGFEIIYEHYKPVLGKRLLYLVGSKEVAYELYQETFLRIWRNLPRTLSISEFEKWLNTIARNLAIDYCRREKRVEFLAWPESESDNAGEYALFGRLSEPGYEERVCAMICLKQALALMSRQYRMCVLLQELWGLTQLEIAHALGIRESTVSANVSRGLKQLRALYMRMMEEQYNAREGDIR